MTLLLLFLAVFSSPEPKAPWELIVWAGSVVRRRPSTISNDISSEITGPIVTNFNQISCVAYRDLGNETNVQMVWVT